MSDLPPATFGIATATGRRRLNEDSLLAEFPVYAVADGMGGHEAGEVASAIAVRALAALAGRENLTIDDVASTLQEAAGQVSAIETQPGFGAGTTVTGACLTLHDDQPYWLVFNVGDSRTYLLADGHLDQVSVDHSEAQELVDAGELAPEEAATYHRRNVITRALGAPGAATPDFWLIPLGESDRVLVCSDGLSGEVPDDRIAQVLLTTPNPQHAADALIAVALAGGGRDNVSVLVVDASANPDADTLPRPSDATTDDDTLPSGDEP